MSRYTGCFLIILFLFSCGRTEEDELSRVKLLPDVLDFKGFPANKDDRSVYSFCDLGAWHSYAVPNREDMAGGFVGPFTMARDNGVWAGKRFAHFLMTTEQGQQIAYQFGEDQDQYPGYLRQNLETVGGIFDVNLTLFFVSNRSAIVSSKVINRSEDTLTIIPQWLGDTWLDDAYYAMDTTGAPTLKFKNSETIHQYKFQESVTTTISDSSFYSASLEPVTINPSDTFSTAVQYSVLFEGDAEEAFPSGSLSVETQFHENQRRWKKYHLAVPYAEDHWLQKDSFELLKSKAIQTMIINWKSAAGELDHDGLFPSYAYKGFHGFWAWDSWKHATALAKFEPQLAKDQMWAMFDFQNDAGMIADCIFRDTVIENHNWRDTKPPLSVWAVHEIFKQTEDTAFVRQIFPKLMKYHNWWYQERDHNGNGWCEYGSTDGTRVAAAWESGMDNAVRFDEAQLIKNSATAWSLDQESIDLNAYLLLEKSMLKELAMVLGYKATQDTLQQSLSSLQSGLSRFYDDSTGYFFDFHTSQNQLIKIPGPEGWIPLWTGVAHVNQAEGVKNIIMDDTLFNSHVPFPTLNLANPEFDPLQGYWRGPVWMDQAYFAITGLEQYGYTAEAQQLKKNLVHHAQGMLTKGFPLHENYHPVTGEALNAAHFSWTAAHVLLLLTHE